MKIKAPNQMTLPEYEVMSNQTRSIGWRAVGSELGPQSQLPDFHGMQEIAEKDDTSNHESSVEIAATYLDEPRKKKQQRKQDSPERIIHGDGAAQQLVGMGIVDSQTIENADSGLGFNKLKEQVNNERYNKNPRVWSAVGGVQGGKLAKNMSQRAFQTQGKFMGARLSSRRTLDKVISYDTASLLEDIPEKWEKEKENANKNNVPNLKLN